MNKKEFLDIFISLSEKSTSLTDKELEQHFQFKKLVNEGGKFIIGFVLQRLKDDVKVEKLCLLLLPHLISIGYTKKDQWLKWGKQYGYLV